jgi:hypothetical protein
MPNYYAVITGNTVNNVIVADTEEIAIDVTNSEVLETTGEPWIDWTRTDGVWSAPIEEEPEVTND